MDVKITYSYNGNKFFGMQRQKNKITVQGEIERIIFQVFNEKINLVSSGRTDANVHALSQVSNFSINKNIPLLSIKKQINKSLYSKLKIEKIEEVNKNFNARYDAKKRIYEYRIKKQKDINVFEAEYVTAISDKIEIDVEIINKKLKLFIGEHNFTNFSKKDKVYKNPVREIYNAYCYEKNNTYYVEIEANSFLRSMVRMIVASSIYDSVDLIQKKLNLEKYNKANKILSPYGLYLKEVIYEY